MLNMASLVRELGKRTERFERWKKRLVENPDVMAGEAVFPKSRLTVRRIGQLLEQGESAAEIREDYLYLSDEDLEMARLYLRAYPRVGRPGAAHLSPRGGENSAVAKTPPAKGGRRGRHGGLQRSRRRPDRGR